MLNVEKSWINLRENLGKNVEKNCAKTSLMNFKDQNLGKTTGFTVFMNKFFTRVYTVKFGFFYLLDKSFTQFPQGLLLI